MPTVVYNPPKGRGSFSKSMPDGKLLIFTAGKARTDLADDIIESLKGAKHFVIDGIPTEHMRPATLHGGREDPDAAGRPVLPANGFSTKAQAIAFAAAHFPDMSPKPTAKMALPTITKAIEAEWLKQYGNAPAPAAADDDFDSADGAAGGIDV